MRIITPARFGSASVPAALLADRHGKKALFLLSLLFFWGLIFVWNIQAHAAGMSASQMSVSVQPEYDDPRVLVINQADLDPELKLPVDVAFNIPKGAEIGMACEVDASGGHACKPYRMADKGDYQELTFNVASQHKVFLEYYYSAYPAGAGAHSFDFIYRPAFPARSLKMEVQQPLRSAGFTLSPAFEQAAADGQGFTVHSQEYKDVAVGRPLRVKISYSKTDGSPSLPPKEKDDAGVVPPPADAGSGSSRQVLLFVLVVLGVGVLIFAAYMLFRPGGSDTVSERGRKEKKTAGSAGAGKGPQATGDFKFCTACGAKLRRADRFCSQCGNGQT